MLPAPDQQRRLVEQLTVFKERLLDVNSRNPSLLLRREAQARCFDLVKLGAPLADELHGRLTSGTASLRLLPAADDSTGAVQQRRHLQTLARSAKSREDETGLQELYVGFCWLTGHVAPDAYLRGPLLLVPAQLEQLKGNRDAGWHLRLDVGELVINEAIVGAIRKHRGVRLPAELAENVAQLLESLRAEAGPPGSSQERLLAGLRPLLVAGGLNLGLAAAQSAQALKNLTADTIPRQPTELLLTRELVLGLFPQGSTALYADLETLIERALGGEVDLGIVDNLLEAAADTPEALPGEGDGQAAAQDIPEAAVSAVVACDPSQHQVLKLAQSAECLVVRGPPGTGKSQVIVNLVSDAMARGKRVLVVCQKRAALDVVHRRLDEVGLGAAVALVHDAVADRGALYKRLHGLLQTSPASSPLAGQDPAVQAAQVDALVQRLRRLTDPLATEAHGLRLYETYAKAEAGFQTKIALPGELSAGDYDSLRQTTECVARCQPGYVRFDVPAHPLALRRNWANFGHLETAGLEQAFGALLSEAKQGGNVVNLPDSSVASALLAHLDTFLALRSSWYRWLLPRWWKTRSVVAQANAWFQGTSLELWRGLLERFQRLSGSLDTISASMQASWRMEHAQRLTDLNGLAISAERAGDALRRDLAAIRSHDRARAELSRSGAAAMELCAAQLPPSADWAGHLQQEALLRWIDEAEDRTPRLRDRIADEHQQLRRELGQKIEQRRAAVASELAQRLRHASMTPSLDPREKAHGNRKPATDWNKLAHELGKKSRIKPLRGLIAEFAWPMQQVIRCWLASPEVVAEVFPLERSAFDVVIFDEASQLTLERALPVLYRAAQVVIAGDEQQMPPSDFFSSSVDDDEEDTMASEAPSASEARFADSLLSQAKRIYGFRYLAWHYRSLYQQLIEFSNQAFYDGALQIAANIDTAAGKPPIEWIPVEGVWVDQTNPVEVVRAVDELKKLLLEGASTPRSVGIITFNQKQQVAILDEIESRRKLDAEFEVAYARAENPASGSVDDKPFVKNIENVQGDERDFIIFSVGYAKGHDGVMRRNFGPLNLSGGENRLNVAVTRAKRGVKVICSFDPDTLAVETAKNRGPLLFKQYLQYARAVSQKDLVRVNGVLADLGSDHQTSSIVSGAPSFDSPLAEQIYDALTARGLKLFTQWGAGGYSIDLVVVDPRDPSRLCLGIECDGARYHSGRSVRERDLARQGFLESRGWKIHRIWSRDWWSDPQAEIVKVLAQLPGIDGV